MNTSYRRTDATEFCHTDLSLALECRRPHFDLAIFAATHKTLGARVQAVDGALVRNDCLNQPPSLKAVQPSVLRPYDGSTSSPRNAQHGLNLALPSNQTTLTDNVPSLQRVELDVFDSALHNAVTVRRHVNAQHFLKTTLKGAEEQIVPPVPNANLVKQSHASTDQTITISTTKT